MSEQLQNGAPDPAAAQPQAPAATGAPTPVPARHRHRFLIGTAFVLATIVGIVAAHAVWLNRQALNTTNWTNTSSQLLANKQIQTAVAAYTVNELFKSGVPQAKIAAALPTQLRPLAGPVSSGVQQLAGQLAPRVLASPQVQSAWRQANRTAHTALLRIINGGSSIASTNNGVVTLNLHAIVTQLATSLGVQQQVAAAQSKLQANAGKVQGAAKQIGIALPPSSGQLVIMRSNQLKTVQDLAGGIKGLALLLPLIAFALFILAVWLSRDHRQQALRTTGWCFVGIGLFVLLDRRLAGNEVINALVKNPQNKPAAHEVWAIGTTLLYDIAVAVIAYGLIFVLAAWLAGHTRPARALRRTLAPTLRTRPAAGYVAVYIALLLVVFWGPTPATRQIVYILGFIVLLAVGVHALRRQTAMEFPGAQPGGMMPAADAARSAGSAGAVAAPGLNGGRVAGLERLAKLHDDGALTDSEFAAEKAVLMKSP